MTNWPAVLEKARERGVAACDLARELGVTAMAVSKQASKCGVRLSRKLPGRKFAHPYKPKFSCPEEWGLTGQQAQLVAVLVDADGEVSNRELVDKVTLYDRDPKILDVVLCVTRRKLRPFGVLIHRFYGKGLFLDPVQRKRLRAGAVILKPSERTR